MAETFEESNIPYRMIASKLFPTRKEQLLVPFLGAGASANMPETADPRPPTFPSEAELTSIIEALKLVGDGYKDNRLFVAFSLAVAYLMFTAAQEPGDAQARLQHELAADLFPPSAGKLVDLFAQLSQYSAFHDAAKALGARWPWTEKPSAIDPPTNDDLIRALKLLVRATGLWGAEDSLTSVTAYYQTLAGRKDLWDRLASIIAPKKTPNIAHKLVARAARHHLENVRGVEDSRIPTSHYLIITTNYDTLIETALEDTPHVVLVLKRSDGQIYPRFSGLPEQNVARLRRRNLPGKPKDFSLDLDDPLVIVYKAHGCLAEYQKFEDDSVVISDFDYEEYIASMAENGDLIPGVLRDFMQFKSFLFMGYSLSDWNLRAALRPIRKARGVGTQDYAVLARKSKASELYCQENKIIILQTSLKKFSAGVLPPDSPGAFTAVATG